MAGTRMRASGSLLGAPGGASELPPSVLAMAGRGLASPPTAPAAGIR